MEPLYVDWATLKSFVTAKSLSIQYVTIESTYRLRAIDGFFCLDCSIFKDGNDDQVDFETNFKPAGNKLVVQSTSVQSVPSFGAKTFLSNGVVKKLFARNTGFQQAVTTGSNVINYTATYAWAKVLGVEIIGGETLDYVDFEVYDTAAGTYSGVANALLNKFAYSHNIAKDYYVRLSQFDADLYVGMIIKITYNSQSNKTVAINLIMNEVK